MNKILAIILAIGMLACSQTENKKAEDKVLDLESIKTKVMELHDEVMPEMGNLRKQEKALRKKAEELRENSEDAAAEKLEKLADDVAAAKDDMMSWMRQFDPTVEGSKEELEKYMSDQLKSIKKVNKKMKKALKDAKESLDQ
jgi:gas vesicle protein